MFFEHLGYKVGISGLVGIERRHILGEIFNSDLSEVIALSNKREWGNPKSETRLQKMTNSIAEFCRNEKRKSNPSEIDILEWENDLDWLKKTF